MFAYCENNPVNVVDPTGEDAWWLQDTNAVFGCGHTSLLIQESKGKWWYFYWGPNEIRLIYIGTCSLYSLNELLTGKKDKSGDYYYHEWYDSYIKIQGNFYQSLEYIARLFGKSFSAIKNSKDGYCKGYSVHKNSAYNLITNNCMQVSTDALMRGFFYYYENTYKRALQLVRLYTVPNGAYAFLKSVGGCISFYKTASHGMIARYVSPMILAIAKSRGIW